MGGHGDHLLSSTVDVTQFHDYRIEGSPTGSFEVLVDSVSIGTLTARVSSVPDQLYFGDGTAGANAQSDITGYSFTQTPPADTTPPSISITTPASANYLLHQ